VAVTAKSVLLLHGGRFGQSEKIARAVAEVLTERGCVVDLQELTKTSAPDPQRHEALAVVTSVRYGHFDPHARDLLIRHRAWAQAVPNLLMTVSLTARTPEKRDPAVHSYTKKFLERIGWQPAHCVVVAGALRYPLYSWYDRLAIQLIMRITGGVTDPTADIEYTDWDQVRDSAEEFAGDILKARTETI
jgi:menaquinone-dependent protoporphyrinogen oxidase